MTDYEKIITGMKHCLNILKFKNACENCPYKSNGKDRERESGCSIQIMIDAFEMLQKQQHQIEAVKRILE